MCGIAGFLGSPTRSTPAAILRQMTQALAHRGPDDQGLWLDQDAAIALGQRRLAIIDLSPAGHQPMHSACDRYVCTFNGEIYNHLALRQQLEAGQQAPTWRGHSDTESLLACFTAWGITPTLQQTVGMFAIALWDKQERQLYLMRDRMGEKPLYYGWLAGLFVFASELKALQPFLAQSATVNRDALATYLQLGYIPAPHSIYEGIHKLEPGQYLQISTADKGKPVKPRTWWSMRDTALKAAQNPFRSETEALAALEQQLRTSVRLQAQADVPLGAFLSGGVDSSLMTALLQAESTQPVRTFTIGFEQAGFNEAQHARAVAKHLGTLHTELQVGGQEALAVIPQLPVFYDEPFADTSQIPTWLVCQQARQHVTVALSGDAGDELFGGYSSYLWSGRIWQKVAWLPAAGRNALSQLITALPPTHWNQLARLISHSPQEQLGDHLHKLANALRNTQSVHDLFLNLATRWPATEQLVIGGGHGQPAQGMWNTPLETLGSEQPGWTNEQSMLLFDSMTELPGDILCKIDRAAMANSLETRIPLLDHRLFELAWRLPPAMKIRQGQGKWALRQILYRHVPAELIERPKQGFNVPLASWLRGELRDWAEHLLDENRMREQGYLQVAPVRRHWQQFLQGKGSHQHKLWTVLMFQAWLEHWHP